MDVKFDRGTLRLLRLSVRARAASAGMSADRVADVTLAVHELAANAVRYGGGSGLLHLQVSDSELVCQVTDAGSPGPRAQAGGSDGNRPAADRQPGKFPWPFQPGHGLWLVRKIADSLSAVTGPAGSQVTAMFRLAPVKAATA